MGFGHEKLDVYRAAIPIPTPRGTKSRRIANGSRRRLTARLNRSVGHEIMTTPDDICPDFAEWPDRWAGVKEDVTYGNGLLDAMRPFVVHLISRELRQKTLRTHIDNLWLLGGEVIRSVSMFDQYDISPEENLRRNVDADGGPYCRHLHSEHQEQSYDATCRKLHKFLEAIKRSGQERECDGTYAQRYQSCIASIR